MSTLQQSLQFKINEVSVVLSNGQKFDLSGVFDEINLFENMFTPCRSGNILIRDSIGLYNKMNFKGNETIRIDINKAENNPKVLNYIKEFKIYTCTDRQNINPTSQTYVLHFVNEDFVYSMQKKVSQSYTGLYSNMISKILTDQLRVSLSKPNNGKSGVAQIYPTDKIKEFVIPNLTPFDAIDWITKRSISSQYKVPDFVFYENALGYNFVPVSKLWSDGVRWKVNVTPKNLDNDAGSEFLGARDLKVLSQFSMGEGIKEGVFGGKFVGFDTQTKTKVVQTVKDVYSDTSSRANRNQNMTTSKNKEGKDFREMTDSRLVVYPFSLPRETIPYVRQNSPKLASIIDDTHNYVFQRKAYFTNMMQRRLQLVMPGNFGLSCGYLIDLNVPKFSTADTTQPLDDTLSGKYIITGTRHIINYNKHETVIEVATDTTKR